MPSLGLTGEITESKQFEWRIANFLSLPAEVGSYYLSPSFSHGNALWHLQLYPKGNTYCKSGFLSMFLVNGSDSDRYGTLKLCIKKSDGTLIVCVSGKAHMKVSIGCGTENFFKRSFLQERESELIPSGILSIICILTLPGDKKKASTKDKQVESSHENQTPQEEHKILAEVDLLSKNFRDLYTNEDCCDAVLLVQNKEFKVHKSILIARSPVFAAMFRHDTAEKKTGEVKIPDCDVDSFGHFLEYLYSGRLEGISSSSALPLYRTSDKYNVQELKTFCSNYLMQNLTTQNFCDVITLADEYDETNLLSSAQEFFNKNFKGIFVTCEWKNLLKNNFRLADKLLVEMSNAIE